MLFRYIPVVLIFYYKELKASWEAIAAETTLKYTTQGYYILSTNTQQYLRNTFYAAS